MAALPFIPENYHQIIAQPADNSDYFTEAYLNQMLTHYFGAAGEVAAAKTIVDSSQAPQSNRIRTQMACVILSEGNLTKLKSEIGGADVDYRDTLMRFR